MLLSELRFLQDNSPSLPNLADFRFCLVMEARQAPLIRHRRRSEYLNIYIYQPLPLSLPNPLLPYQRLFTTMPPSTPPRPTQILLLGAGELGLALLQHISSLPSVHITLGVRSPSKHTSLLSTCHNLSLLALDLTSHSSVLVPVFAEYDIIISATGFVSGAGSVMKLAEEVLATGKMRQESYSKGKGKGKRKTWFFPWQWGVDYDITGDGNGLMPLFGEQKAVREFLRSKAKECGVR